MLAWELSLQEDTRRRTPPRRNNTDRDIKHIKESHVRPAGEHMPKHSAALAQYNSGWCNAANVPNKFALGVLVASTWLLRSPAGKANLGTLRFTVFWRLMHLVVRQMPNFKIGAYNGKPALQNCACRNP
jgi:hypothetical protein